MRQSGAVTSPSLEDAALLARVGDGDEAAIEQLYQRYGGACFALARRILDDAQRMARLAKEGSRDP